MRLHDYVSLRSYSPALHRCGRGHDRGYARGDHDDDGHDRGHGSRRYSLLRARAHGHDHGGDGAHAHDHGDDGVHAHGRDHGDDGVHAHDRDHGDDDARALLFRVLLPGVILRS